MADESKRWPQYARVRFTNDRREPEGVRAGTVGYILEVHEDGYEVEVSDESGCTMFVGGVADDDLEVAEP